ncbi:MAG: glycosyltransferase family 4 protein, partial [Actinobacteria bacterium]|nr:glycosyltransferase family 4 protein [Actinomycetota bacterium]
MASPETRRVLFDLQATQTVDQRHRGIARYAHELALAVEASFPDHVGAYLMNPDLALSETIEQLVGTGKVVPIDEVDWRPDAILHTVSLFEMSVPLRRVLPPGALRAGVGWTVTFHDLIPVLMPDAYLEDPGRRRRYMARLQLLRMADAVLTNSAATRADAVRHLGLEEDQVVVAGTGTGPQFVPPPSRTDAAAAAVTAVGGMSARYVFYVGGFDRRKNLEPLLIAWSLLDPAVRAGRTLVVCAVPDRLDRHHLLHFAAELGISGEVRLTGVLPDETLLLLHQGAELFVFPSLYEGYGLPVAEALACGAPVLAADTSSLPEIVEPEALFDPNDPDAIAAAVTRGLTDAAFRARRLAAAGRPPSTWAEVAGAVVDAHRRLADGTSAPRNRAPLPARPGRRVAFVGALPPDGGQTGGRNARLVEALGERLEVRAFADRPVDAPHQLRKLETLGGAPVSPLAALEAAEGARGPFDAVVYA